MTSLAPTTRQQASCNMPDHGSEKAAAPCCQPSSPNYMDGSDMDGSDMGAIALDANGEAATFWRNTDTWWRASKNTLNCLIGCSIGDFGMLVYLQTYHPETPIMVQMALAMTTGLITSILLESAILKAKEGFAWSEAFKVAFSMSFISMLGMELAENITDFALTGGTASPATAWFWIALGISLMVGFLAPLPYNYYKLQKHGEACH
jgi:Sec-independent protein secretion pathway component TatC